jgi:hypothetical protein
MKRNALACSLIMSSVVSLPMLYRVLVNGSLSSDVALRRYLIILSVSLVAGPLLALAFSGSAGSSQRTKAPNVREDGRRSGDDRRSAAPRD